MHNVNYKQHVPGFIESQFMRFRPKNGNTFNINNVDNNEIVFDIKTTQKGQFIDPKKSYFDFEFTLTRTGGTATNYGLRFERSAGSIIKGYKIQSGFGLDLECVLDYNHVDAMMCIMDSGSDAPTEDGRGALLGSSYYTNTTLALMPMLRKDLGAVLCANLNTEAYSNNLANISTTAFPPHFIHQLRSSLFGVYSTKYIPLSMMKGLRITLTLNYLKFSLMTTLANYSDTTWTVTVKPVLVAYYITVPAQIERQIAQKGKIPIPGIGLRTYRLPTDYTAGTGARERNFILPIKVKSLRAVFFGFLYSNDGGTGYDHTGADAAAYTPSYNSMQTAYSFAGILSYQFFLDQRPTIDTPVDLYPLNMALSSTQLKLALGIDLMDKTGYSHLLKRSMMNSYSDYDSRQNTYYRNMIYGEGFPGTDMSTFDRVLELRLQFNIDFPNTGVVMYLYDQTLWVDYETGESFVDK